MVQIKKIEKILIANRGEIAVRIIRACRELGLRTVAVYSDCDRDTMPVRMADEAYPIGKPEPRESYLVADKIVAVARKSGADAVHPGYGFLSENAEFAELCQNQGIRFIGPLPETIRTMGDKLNARKLAMKAGVPVVPGSENPIESVEEAMKLAAGIGFPVMVKASAGGGGKGMRMVETGEDFPEAFERASSEALSAFGNGSLYLEKYFTQPRHIEFQVVADTHGQIVHLFERECSVQRRHQKVIEETPSCALNPNLRERMGADAIAIAKASDYLGVGTVEFLFEQGRYYFLEMNTRLQVEHPITEMTTGIDLVKLQIAIAEGERLTSLIAPPRQFGHAIECRIYAEDSDEFIPCPGTIRCLKVPDGPFVRNDSYAESGMVIPLFYDPMISKLVAWGNDRQEAIERMRRALREYVITGIDNNIALHLRILDHPVFRSGDYDTSFIARHYKGDRCSFSADLEMIVVAAAIARDRKERNDVGCLDEAMTTSGLSWKSAGFYERLR